VSGDDLLGLAPPTGLAQLAAFRHVFDTGLLPQLAARTGPWALGPAFAGSELIKADADLIAAGLLLELKSSAKLSLGITDLLRVMGYALLDFDDGYRVAELGIFAARHGYLAIWELGDLLSELPGTRSASSLPGTNSGVFCSHARVRDEPCRGCCCAAVRHPHDAGPYDPTARPAELLRSQGNLWVACEKLARKPDF